ncbi:FAD-binding protein [Nannocystis pusilla]|uniref:FAD-binding protein n=1 Tax=Nannocystis pusilla TaxID=889268 RepID=A0A9X3ER53_9BACT|nr:FAD-binding protein [Nannocystis pusilla]MCY1007854.1 FAD-binding protein [Nannocystis pusilla]
MTIHSTRRAFLRSGAAAVPVLAFSPSAQAWLTCSDAAADAFEIPGLEGELLTGPADRAAAADDWGHIVSKTPLAVLVPASIDDIRKAVKFCRKHCIKVGPMSMVGNSHSTQGQSQAKCGLVIDMSALAEIHAINAGDAVVDAGVRWFELLQQTLPLGKSPPVLTDHIDLSIGGTLSVGGIGGQTPQHGLQADNVLELWVVTGDGDLEVCSPTTKATLFNSVRGGLGQFGIIVKARVKLIAVKPLARHYTAVYADVATLLADQVALMNEGRFDYVEGLGFPQPDDSYVITIECVKYFDAGSPPDDAAMLAGLNFIPGTEAADTQTLYEFFDRLAPIVAFTKITGEWYLPHPLTDFFLPLSEAADFIESTLAETPAIDIGYGPVLIYPFPRSKVTAPFIPLASEPVNVLFSLLRWAPSADPAVAADLVAKNRAVYEGVREVGGKRYSIGSVELNFADWVLHYGARWPQFLARKLIFDPTNTLTPGQGIFLW